VHQRLQADLGVAEQPRRDRGVEHRTKHEPEVAPHRRHVVVAAVDDLEDRCIREQRRERREVVDGQRIKQPRLAAERGQLEQADLLGVVVQAVGLGVKPDRPAAGEALDELDELVGGANPSSGREGTHGSP
jgi:hypothetical protein